MSISQQSQTKRTQHEQQHTTLNTKCQILFFFQNKNATQIDQFNFASNRNIDKATGRVALSQPEKRSDGQQDTQL